MENKATGYIKVFRSLKTHWLWHDATKLKWWLDILLSTNYSDQKVLLKGTLVECGRGQCIKSLETWAKEWRTTKKTVQTFLRLLQKDEMIFVENVKVTTRITICNYDSYNNSVNEGYTAEDTKPTTHGKRSLPPNNKGNKGNKDNKEDFIPTEKQSELFLKFTEWMQRNTPSVLKMSKPITAKQFFILRGEIPNSKGRVISITKDECQTMLLKIENNKDYLKKYRSPYLCITTWHEDNLKNKTA